MRTTSSANEPVALPMEQRLGTLLRLAHRQVRDSMTESLRALRINHWQYAILADLSDAGTPLSQAVIAAHYRVGKQRIARECMALAERGLIELRAGAGGTTVEVTDLGIALLSASTKIVAKALGDLSRRFTDAEWKCGMDFLMRLVSPPPAKRSRPVAINDRRIAGR